MKIVLVLLGLCLVVACENKQQSFPSLNLDREKITVSGISSGGYMAHQYHIAFAEQVDGAALIASGPFGCAQGDLQFALDHCVSSKSKPETEQLVEKIGIAAKRGEIGKLDSLKEDKVWIFHGTEDERVSREVTQSQIDLYRSLGAMVKTKLDVPAGHGFPTQSFGVDCDASSSPHINNCEYDAVKEFFSFFFGELNPKVTTRGQLLSFEQNQFAHGENYLADKGYVFIPLSCLEGETCKLHISFHGCSQNYESIEDLFIKNAGYNQWAESNNLVVVYPQTKSSFMPLNPKACWDWWGYTGKDYQTRKGAQLGQIYEMTKLLGKRSI